MEWTVYGTRAKNSSKVGKSFAIGAGIKYYDIPCPQREGGLVSYGDGHGLRPYLQRAIDAGTPWIYMDNGYFKAGHFYGYYRVTTGDYQHDGRGNAGPRRWERLQLDLKMKPWRKDGSFVLICPPGSSFGRWRGLNLAHWLEETVATLKQHTDRKIVVREKPSTRERRDNPIEAALAGAHALVTYASNTAVHALLYGVPVFSTAACAASCMGHSDLSLIESPLYPADREQWAWNLAANQWTLREMESGQCWRELKK